MDSVARTPRVSYWVVRVLVGSSLAARVAAAGRPLSALLDDGVLALSPAMDVIEGVASADSDEHLHAVRDVMAAKYPAEDFRVVMMVGGGT